MRNYVTFPVTTWILHVTVTLHVTLKRHSQRHIFRKQKDISKVHRANKPFDRILEVLGSADVGVGGFSLGID